MAKRQIRFANLSTLELSLWRLGFGVWDFQN